MTPRERIRSALVHQRPDRVPFSWGFGPTPEMAESLRRYLAPRGIDWEKLRDATDDKVRVGPRYIGPDLPQGHVQYGIWGIHLKTMSYGAGAYEEFTDFPLAGIEDPRALDNHPWPQPAWFDYAGLRAEIERANPGGARAVQFLAGNPFELYSWMTGVEEALLNLASQPALVTRALEYISGFIETHTQRVLQAAGALVDIVFLADDLGGQTGLLMSREVYRKILQPFHRRLCQCVRTYAPHAHRMYHTDGAVFEVIPDLLDAGVDVLEAVQTDAAGMDPARLKAAYGDRLAFHGAISVQQLLPHADSATVERECRRLAAILGAHGGYIAAPAHAIQVGTPPENVLAMLRAVLGEKDLAAALQASRH